jgi:hypothetical protein
MRDITGTWRLLRAQAWDKDGNPRPAPYDGNAIGRIVIDRSPRMSVMVVDPRPDLPAGQKREYGGYSGPFTFDGTTLITTPDAAPDPSRIGAKQPRGVRFEGDLMVLRPPPRGEGDAWEQRELTWERISEV